MDLSEIFAHLFGSSNPVNAAPKAAAKSLGFMPTLNKLNDLFGPAAALTIAKMPIGLLNGAGGGSNAQTPIIPQANFVGNQPSQNVIPSLPLYHSPVPIENNMRKQLLLKMIMGDNGLGGVSY